MGNNIESPQALLDKIRIQYGLSMKEIAKQTDVSLASLYRIQQGSNCKWSIQERLWALSHRLDGDC